MKVPKLTYNHPCFWSHFLSFRLSPATRLQATDLLHLQRHVPVLLQQNRTLTSAFKEDIRLGLPSGQRWVFNLREFRLRFFRSFVRARDENRSPPSPSLFVQCFILNPAAL
jgi:hypothetical protein